MRILTIHNKYRSRGGEDESCDAESRLLRCRGHEVRELVFDNARITCASAFATGFRAVWSRAAYARVKRVISAWRPDVLSIHNFFPLASPAVHYAGRDAGVPVVQTLHNFRLLCPGATLFRDGSICESCLQYSLPWPGVIHRCYRDSASASAAVAFMLTIHRLMKTWERAVSLFIAVSEFERSKFIENGFSPERMVVRPNIVVDECLPGSGGDAFLYVGRLSPEKGIKTLLESVEYANAVVHLDIVGDGPLSDVVSSAAARNPRIRYHGRRSQPQVLEMMRHAKCLVFPSEWYETFGRVAAEAFACGTPVIAARVGAVAEIVADRTTGLHFDPGSAKGLGEVMQWAYAHPDAMATMRERARREFESKYAPDRVYQLTVDALERAIANP
jgi:glycosyltransferase involved in cell wall biosynthesis